MSYYVDADDTVAYNECNGIHDKTWPTFLILDIQYFGHEIKNQLATLTSLLEDQVPKTSAMMTKGCVSFHFYFR